MEKLISNITKLIAQHNCVILPGIGAFLAHKVPAYYDAKEKIFMPPHRSLGFNPSVKVDDALLLSEYMNCDGTSYSEAATTLSDDTARLRSMLSRKGFLRFGELGTFTMDIDGIISFEPSENSLDDPYNYGFEPFAISPLSELKKKDIVIKHNNIGKYISMVAAAIILIFMLAPIANSIYDNDNQLSVAGFTPVENSVKQEIATPAPDFREELPATEIATGYLYLTDDVMKSQLSLYRSDDIMVPYMPVNEPIAKQDRDTYSIIVANTSDCSEAHMLIAEFSKIQRADYSIIDNGDNYRIVIESHKRKSDAMKALRRIKATFPKAWVLIHR